MVVETLVRAVYAGTVDGLQGTSGLHGCSTVPIR
jgi:hypothetical protein